MPGWTYEVLPDGIGDTIEIYGPPFEEASGGSYEEPKGWAAWGGSIWNTVDAWDPLMFRTGGGACTTPTSPSLVLRRSSRQTRSNIRNLPSIAPIANDLTPEEWTELRHRKQAYSSLYERDKCYRVELVVSSADFVDRSNPVLPPQEYIESVEAREKMQEEIDAEWEELVSGIGEGLEDEEVGRWKHDDSEIVNLMGKKDVIEAGETWWPKMKSVRAKEFARLPKEDEVEYLKYLLREAERQK
ncbi:hypothetical protein ABW19_dt0210131 [Dactylella cylindrospora]|nr:hypothetical protein ABW19_dt0210131 [Dactylella cylindrospora]